MLSACADPASITVEHVGDHPAGAHLARALQAAADGAEVGSDYRVSLFTAATPSGAVAVSVVITRGEKELAGSALIVVPLDTPQGVEHVAQRLAANLEDLK